MKHILLFFLIFGLSVTAKAESKIVATYPPIQSLVLSITEGVQPVNILIRKPEGGHHDVQLKPSQMKILKNADIVFYAADELETFLPDALKAVAPNAYAVSLMEQTPYLKLMPSVSDSKKLDLHYWLDVNNAMNMLDAITKVMVEKDPKNEAKYLANNKKAKGFFEKLKSEERPFAGKKFVALHDGFGYMADYFDLDIESYGIEPEDVSTPQAVRDLRARLSQSKPNCIIVEPDTNRRQLKALDLDDDPTVRMDAFGWNISLGAGQYYRMMRWNLNALKKCK